MSLMDRIKANPLPFAELLGVEYVNAEPDAVTGRMAVRPELCTRGGFAHCEGDRKTSGGDLGAFVGCASAVPVQRLRLAEMFGDVHESVQFLSSLAPASKLSFPASSPQGLRRRLWSFRGACVLQAFRRINPQPLDVERRVLPAVDRLLIRMRRRPAEAASKPDFQCQIVNRLEAVRDGQTHVVNVAFRHCDRSELRLSRLVLPG